MAEVPPTIQEAAALLRSGQLSSVELTRATLRRADLLDGLLGTYLTRFDEQALAAAEAADRDLAAGVDRGPMHGIPVGVKDMVAAKEGPTTAQSLVLDPAWGAGKDAPVVSRLRRAGAVITGKTTTMEFGAGMPDPTKPFPLPRNPWDLGTSPGGSSSGTASGVAAGMFLAGIGTDTGGSIRYPSAFCGISGLKPTYGRVPKSGCVPLGYSLDHVGPMARSAWDCAAMLSVLAGYDPSDPSSADVPVGDYAGELGGSMVGLRIGVEWGHMPGDSDPSVSPRFKAAVEALKGAGGTVVDVSLPYFSEMRAANQVIGMSEALVFPILEVRTLEFPVAAAAAAE